ncbi:MAG: hypothetical protein ABI697_09700 [Devosia sp.]
MAKIIDRPSVQPGTADPTQMTVLARRFGRLKRRCQRHWRRYQSLDDVGDRIAAATAHAAWSAGIDETLRVAEAISQTSARDTAELAIKIEAICWWVAEDDSILDAAVRRWLLRFRGSLRRLAR